jgi:hypothetical protein
MSEREIRRAGVLSRVKKGEVTQLEASAILGMSYRQTKRVYQRYLRGGEQGLVHGNAGKASNRASDEKMRRRALALVSKHYSGKVGERFGPTLTAEHLWEDHGIEVNAETLRRWMLVEGLWTRERKRKPYRQRRARRSHFGDLVQMDGSFEHWLEERGPKGCLIHMVDDATSTSLATFDREETTWGVARTLRAWVEKYGIPGALYVDWKTVYHHEPTARQKRENIVPVSQFGRMCAKLGIQLIGANSPQAKGRVERGHGTHQDRLIKKMRLKKITDYRSAGLFLESYLEQHNAKYAVTAKEAADFHEAVPAGMDLDDVFCLEYERVVGNDWVVQYGSRWLQIENEEKNQTVQPKSSVTVRESEDGSIRLLQNNRLLRWRELPQRPSKQAAPPKQRHVRAPKPSGNHPWRKSANDMKIAAPR